jgi:hypothetical protein
MRLHNNNWILALGVRPRHSAEMDSPAGGRWIRTLGPPATASLLSGPYRSLLRRAGGGEVGTAVQPDFFCSASHSIEPGVHGFGGLRFVALLGGLCVPAVPLIGTCALHRLDQQFAERPYQGINAVRRIPRCGAVDIRGKICHLVFELREGADVMDAALR